VPRPPGPGDQETGWDPWGLRHPPAGKRSDGVVAALTCAQSTVGTLGINLVVYLDERMSPRMNEEDMCGTQAAASLTQWAPGTFLSDASVDLPYLSLGAAARRATASRPTATGRSSALSRSPTVNARCARREVVAAGVNFWVVVLMVVAGRFMPSRRRRGGVLSACCQSRPVVARSSTQGRLRSRTGGVVTSLGSQTVCIAIRPHAGSLVAAPSRRQTLAATAGVLDSRFRLLTLAGPDDVAQPRSSLLCGRRAR